jgi:ubiquinone/menaquinone biosynthesis C-methylase UbiE
MLNSIKDGKGVNQIFKDSVALRVRTDKRCDKIINIAGIKADWNLLEIGCGTGEYAGVISKKTGAKIIGNDINPDFIAAAVKNKNENLDFIVGDATALDFNSQRFDLIYGNGILHHIVNRDKLFSGFAGLLKPDGKIAFIEPNIFNPAVMLIFSRFFKRFFHLDPDEAAFLRSRIRKELESAGFKNVLVKPIDFILPVTPKFLVKLNIVINNVFEKIPLVREMSQSIIIYAER